MTKCMACGEPLTPGYDYPWKPEVVLGVKCDGTVPLVCRDVVACLTRTKKLHPDLVGEIPKRRRS